MALLAAALSAAGCQRSTRGQGTPDAAATRTPQVEATLDTSTPTASGTPTTASRELGKTVWFAGWKVTVADATATVDPQTKSGTLKINTTFGNEGDDTGSFAPITEDLASAGNHYQPGPDADLPQVPGQANGKGVLAFTIDDKFSLDDAVLTFGSSDHQQAVIPLGGSGTLVTLQPTPLAITGTAQADKLKVQLTAGEIRADRPRSHTESDRGALELSVVFNATMTKKKFFQDYPLAATNFSVKLPDGTTVAAEPEGKNIPTLLNLNTTVKNIVLRYKIDDPAAGKYQLLVTDNWDGSRVTKGIPFTVS